MLWGMSQVLPEASWDWTNQHAETKLYLTFTDTASPSYFSSITCYFKAFKVWSPTTYSVDMTTDRTRTWLLPACPIFREHVFFEVCSSHCGAGWRFKSSEMQCHAEWQTVTTVSKGHGVFETLLTWSLVTIKQTFCMTFHLFFPLATICLGFQYIRTLNEQL